VTASENFVSRWARLKRNADVQHRMEPAGDALLLPASQASPSSAEAAIPRIGAVDEPFDPARLPSIETITVNTDIRGFLQSRVPVELTRAALRQAWASDPAIRDFIGIAENQWDFNDPDAIPGFGPLPEGYDVSGLLSQALGGGDRLAATFSLQLRFSSSQRPRPRTMSWAASCRRPYSKGCCPVWAIP